MDPELSIYIKPLINIIKLVINQFVLDANYIGINDPNFKARNQLSLLFDLLTFDITPCLQINILKLFCELIQNNDEKYYNYLNKNNAINIITLFVYKTSVFDVKELAFKFLVRLIKYNSKKNNNLEQYIERFTTYFNYSNAKDEENTQKATNIKKSFERKKVKYKLQEFNENEKQLLSLYDKKHFNELMNQIFDRAAYFYKEKI